MLPEGRRWEAESDDDDWEPPVDFARRKRRLVIGLIAYFGMLGLFVDFLPREGSPIDLAIVFPALIMQIVWCHADASQHGRSISKFMTIALVLFFVLAFPVYVFRVHGWRGFGTLAWTGLVCAAMVASGMLGGFLASFISWTAGVPQ